MFRRLAMRVAAIVALTLVIASPVVAAQVAAQAEGNTVTVNLTTCSQTGGLPGITFADVANPSGTGHDCINGWPESVWITLNDEAPSSTTADSVTWTEVPSGEATLNGLAAVVDGGQITVDGDVTLAGTYSQSDLDDTVTIYLMTCTVTGSADSASVAANGNDKGVGRDCVDGYPDGFAESITLDGVAPEYVTDQSVAWNNVAAGEHVAESGDGTVGGGYTFTFVPGTDVLLWSTYYKHVRGDEVVPTAVSTAVTTPAADDSTTGAAVTSLPNTGSGDPLAIPAGMGAALLAAGLIAGAGAAAGARARRR